MATTTIEQAERAFEAAEDTWLRHHHSCSPCDGEHNNPHRPCLCQRYPCEDCPRLYARFQAAKASLERAIQRDEDDYAEELAAERRSRAE